MNADRLATYIHSVITPITLNFKLFARASSTRHYYLMIGSAYIREEEEMSFNVTIDGEAYDLSHIDNGMEIDSWTN